MSVLGRVAGMVAVVGWASAFAGLRISLASFNPGALALLRFGVASLVFAVVALVHRPRRPQGRDLLLFGLAGLTGVSFYHVALNTGQAMITASAASVIANLAPIFVALLATVILGERLEPIGWIGLAVAFVGAVIIAIGESPGLHLNVGAFYVLAGSLSVSCYFVIQKGLMERYTAIEATMYVIWFGTALLLVFAGDLVATVGSASVGTLVTGVYLGVVPSALAYLAWSIALNELPASRVSGLLYLIPVFATIIAWLWIGELPSLLALLGGVIVLVGVWTVGHSERVRSRTDGIPQAA